MKKVKKLTSDDILRAIVLFNVKHRKYKIEYDIDSNFFTFKDKDNNYKCFITIPYLKDIEELLDLLEDLRKDLS